MHVGSLSLLLIGAFSLLLATLISGCGSQSTEQDSAIAPIAYPSPPTPAAEPKSVSVQTHDLMQPHHNLGALEYEEPYSPEAIDDDHIDDKLRAMAVQRWGAQVDAVVLVKTSLSSDRRTVSVSAEGAHLDAPTCSICRVSAESSSP